MAIALWTFPFPLGFQKNLLAQEKEETDSFRLGIDRYRDLEYESALKSFQEALEEPQHAKERRAAIYIGIGASYVVLNDQEHAVKAFLSALELDPKISLFPPFDAPKIVTAFEEASQEFHQKIRLFDREPPKIFFTPFEGAVPSESRLDVEALITDNVQISAVRLFFRRIGDLAYTEFRMNPIEPTRYVASIPSFMVTGEALEYYIEATDEAGNVALDGNAARPYQVVLKSKIPWYKNWLTWSGIVVVLASVGGLYLSIKNDPDILALKGESEGTMGFIIQRGDPNAE